MLIFEVYKSPWPNKSRPLRIFRLNVNVSLRYVYRDLHWYLYFVVLTCPLTELDGFDQHFQATVHFLLTSAIDKHQQHQ